MESSEGLDLDSLIDLLDEDDLESESNSISKAQTVTPQSSNESQDSDLDSVLSLMTESDLTCNISVDKDKLAKLTNADSDIFSAVVTTRSIKDIPVSMQNGKTSLIHTGDTSEEEEDEKEYLTETGGQIKKKIKLKPSYEIKKRAENTTWKNKANLNGTSNQKACSLDSLTGVRIVNPLIGFDVMEKRLQGRRLIKMSFMKNYTNKGDIEGDWVTVGVVVWKMPPKTAKNGNLYSIWRLTDLHDTDKMIDFFLFGAVYKEHWKTAVGTVIGLLNPTIMESTNKDNYASIKLDHPGKLMQIGTSKDFGQCKSAKKDGSKCTNVVNLSQCQFCAYHVKKEYKKFSSKRSELQTSWTGRDLSLKNKVLKGQNFFYAGQSFVPLGKPERKPKTLSSKDKLTLSSMPLKRKAATVFNEEKTKSIKKIAELYGEDVSKAAAKNSEFINNQLTIPCAGSRNFLQHMVKERAVKEGNVSLLSPKELLKQNALHMKSRTMTPSTKKDDSTILKNLTPVLGRGLSPGQSVSFDATASNSKSTEHYAKLRAIQKIRQSCPIQKKNPNATKSKPDPEKIKAALDDSFEEKSVDVNECKTREAISKGTLGCIDLNSEKVQKYLNRKSSHAYEVEMAEMEKEAAYFARLEKKELMEEKMCSTKEIVCDVVSCKQCRYTAMHAADRCKNENHPLKCHKAIKRFFACKDCSNRTECFSRFPHTSCRNCGSSRFERTGMMRVRSGPKLDSEILNIAGDEARFLNSL